MRNGATVRDVMHREFVGASESDSLGDAAELMLVEDADCLVVLRGRQPVGCLTARDALRAMLDGHDPEETPVSAVMGPPAATVEEDQRLVTAEERIVAEGASRLVVTDGGEAVGVLTERDVLAATSTREEAAETVVVAGGEGESLTQSICEVCGTLTTNLSTAGGQVVCPDCQEV